MDYNFSKDGYKVTKKLKLKRLKAHYSDLFPFNLGFRDKKEVLKLIKEEFMNVDFKDNLIVYCKEDLLKPIFLFGFISIGGYKKYDFLSFYKLLDIYFDKDEDFINFSQINKDYVILYGGYYEIENKLQSEIMNHLIEQRAVESRYTWIYYKGSKNKFKNKYNKIYKVLRSRNYNQIEFKLPPNLEKQVGEEKNNESMDLDIEEI